MKAKHILTPSIVIAGMIAAAPAIAAGKGPAVAIFRSWEYTASASGSACNLTQGEYFEGRLSWPGAGKNGAIWRYQPEFGPGKPEVKEETYPKTPVAGSVTWAGTVKVAVNPIGTTGQYTVDATLTYIDADDFVLERTIRFNNCIETVFASLVRD